MVDSLAENARRDYWPEWSRITAPTLVLLGRSGIIAPQDAEDMLRRRPDTRTVSMLRAGHDLHLEQPDAVCDLLSDFLGDLA
jgi:pimeloyl-ACP methyl ester carboxylesterase